MSGNSGYVQLTCGQAQDAEFGPILACQDFDLTFLFGQSIFGIGVSSLFLLLLPLQLFRLKISRVQVRANAIFWVSLILAFTIIGLQIADTVLWNGFSWIKTATAGAGITTVATIGLTCLVACEYRRSLRTSSLTLLFLLGTCIGDAVQLRGLASRYYSPNLTRVLTATLSLKLALLLMCCWSKGRYVRDKSRPSNPEDLGHIFNRSVFWWLNALLWRGRGEDLTLETLYPLRADLSSGKLLQMSRRAWQKSGHRTSYAWARSVCTLLRWDFLGVMPPRVVMSALSFGQAYFIQACIRHLETNPASRVIAYAHGLIGAAALIYGGLALSNAAFNHHVYLLVTKYRGSTVALLQDKLLSARTADVDSAIATLTSTDIDQSAAGLIAICDLWAQVIEVVIGVWLLWEQIGPAAIAPVLIVALSFGLQSFLSRKLPARQGKWVMAVQQRIGFAVNLLRNLKSAKLAGVALPLSDMLQLKRVQELRAAIPFRWMNVWVNSTANIPNLFSALIVFAAFSIQASTSDGPPLSTAKAFTSLALIGLLTAPATQLLHSIPTVMTALGCMKRIEDYLRTNVDLRIDFCSSSSTSLDNTDGTLLNNLHASSQRLRTGDAIIYSTDLYPDHAVTSAGTTLRVHRGETLIVTGPTGCGKTTFLKTLLSSVGSRTRGTSVIPSYVGHCSQSPWMPNETIRRVIIGPHSFDHTLYDAIVAVCELRHELDEMPHGDETMVGTKGSSLSGGQKQRIALARALYGRFPLIILDDPFSGLDEKTAFRVARNLLGPQGFVKKHTLTVVFATHDARSIRWAEQVLIFSAVNQVEYYGPAQDRAESMLPSSSDVGNTVEFGDGPSRSAVPRGQTQTTRPSPSKRSAGDTSSWLYYGQAVGWLPVAMFLGTIFVAAFGVNFQRLWLKWSTDGNAAAVATFVGVYAAVNIATFLVMVAMLAQMMVVIAPKGAIILHAKLTKTVMTAQLSVLTTTDISTIINRFSQDMTLADLALPATAFGFFLALALCIIELSFITTGSTYMAANIPVLIIVVYGIQNFYLRTSRQMRLLDLEAKAPLYQSLAEVQDGLVTIAALGWRTFCQESFLNKLDESQRPYYLMFCIQRWLSLVLQLTVAGLAVVLVTLALLVPSSTSSGSLGVALTSIIAFGSSLQAVIEAWTTTETTLAAVTRTRDFVRDTPVETSSETADSDLPESWPQGSVKIHGLDITYTTGAQPITGLTFEIPRGSKFAITGRTGSGKSTLLAALLRVVEPSNGTIMIDGVDITDITHETLRSRLICLPQDPLLFPGMSLRQNLTLGLDVMTPSNMDGDILSALEALGLGTLSTARGGLEAPYNPGTWSQGEQQLLAFARAVLRRKAIAASALTAGMGRRTILLLDEPTSAMDAVTEERIWTVIEEVFAGDTVILITHKRETMDRCDAVLSLSSEGSARVSWRTSGEADCGNE